MRIATAATLSATLASLPLFLTGAMAVMMRDDLDFGRSALGVAAASFTAATALAAIPGGRVSERVGATRVLSVSACASSVLMLGVAFLSRSALHLVLLLALAGCSNGLAQPATNMLLADGVDARRQGLGFGVKRSSFSVAELLAGLSSAFLAVQVGWRSVWALAAVCTLLVQLLVPKKVRTPARRQPGAPVPRLAGRLRLLSIAGGFGIGAIAALEVYFVESMVDRSLTVSTAGLLLSAGGLAGIAARVAVGWAVDRRVSAPLTVSAFMLVGGAAGFMLLGFADSISAIIAGTVLAFGAGSGWTGLYFLGGVRLQAGGLGAAVGRLEAGMSSGAVIGPLVFSALIASTSLRHAWVIGAASLAVAAALLGAARWEPSAPSASAEPTAGSTE